MKYHGSSFEYGDTLTYPISEATLSGNKLSVDWIEADSSSGRLEATSKDGTVFKGNFGFPHLDEFRHIELQLFKAKNGDIALIGKWWNTSDGRGDDWIFLLAPEEVGK